ncbi:retropepsin-like domain-containing protein [bacterium]|nr:retropepsin-like domain-containing protein [bacterium]
MGKFKFSPNSPSIIINCIVEGPLGQIGASLILDTGATYTHLPWRIIEAIGYDPILEYERVKIITGSGVEYGSKVVVKSLKAMGIKIENVEIVCHDLPPEARVDGLLGLSFLHHLNINLNFKKGIIEVN